jgi:uncharacterized damage-inducible protein DinB
MDPRLGPLASTIDLNTRLVLNCLTGVDDAKARRRITPDTNSMAFLLAHLADARHFLAASLGAPLASPFSHQLQYGRSEDEVGPLPELTMLLEAWENIASHLAAVFPGVEPDQLNTASATRFPIGDATTLGTVAFLVQHESYHLGQLGFLRRALGLPAMSYK